MPMTQRRKVVAERAEHLTERGGEQRERASGGGLRATEQGERRRQTSRRRCDISQAALGEAEHGGGSERRIVFVFILSVGITQPQDIDYPAVGPPLRKCRFSQTMSCWRARQPHGKIKMPVWKNLVCSSDGQYGGMLTFGKAECCRLEKPLKTVVQIVEL